MFKKFCLIIIFLTGIVFNGRAQNITNYFFAASAGNFTNIVNGILPVSGGGTADEGYGNGIPIGFDFWYMGVRYTTISASSNGWITLGADITNATPVNSLNSGGVRPVLAPLWDNLDAQLTSNITYVTTGAAGSRVFTIQFLAMKWSRTASGSTMSFQVKLYEGKGKIEYIYRRETGLLSSPSASIGISATSTGSGNFLSVSSSGTTVSSSTEAGITAKPSTGNTYSFTPPVPLVPGSLTFTAIANTSMTLNWTDLSSNETGFLIYRSADGVNYTFVTQTAADATTSTQTGLTAATNYFWKVYSVSEGGFSSTALSGTQSTTCTLSAPTVTSPVNYCQNATAIQLTATGTSLLWGAVVGSVGGTTPLETTIAYNDNNFSSKKTNFTTTSANVIITSVDFYIPAYQAVSGMVISIYNSGGTIIATSTTNTTSGGASSTTKITNTFNYTIAAAGDYSIGVSAGTGNIGADNPGFPISEITGTINISGVSVAGNRCFNNIQFTSATSSIAPTPSTASAGSVNYFVSQTVGGCKSPQATITVNVTSPNISQIPAANLVANYKFSGNANDASGNNTGTLQNSPVQTADRFNITGGAFSFNGTTQYVSTANAYATPTDFTISIWFKTNTTVGGRLIGFGNAQTGLSGNYDRHIYMNNAGQIYFGVYPNTVVTINSALSYNDNNWHLVTATLSSSAGMALYVDGALASANPSNTAAQNYTGYWRIGYDNNNGWTSQPSSYYFNGSLDDALIYSSALSAAEIATLYLSPDGAGNNGPACIGSAISLSATTVSGGTYSWSGPGFTSSSQNPTFTYSAANAGTYTLQVSVAGCSETAYTNVIATTIPGQWTGKINTDWANAGNWCTGVVPGVSTNVTISSGATNMPSIISSVACNNLTINTGATLTTSVAGTLNIAGTLTNNGTITNGGTTNFNGTTGQQTFSGLSSFYNLTLTNSGGLLLPAAITINNNLLISAGTLDANNFNIIAKGNWTNNVSATAFTAGTGTITFNGSTAQIIGGTFATVFNNLTLANTVSKVTLSVNTSIAGNLSVSGGTFDLAGFTADRATVGGTLTVANNSTLKIGGTNTYPINYTINTLVVASTVEYSGTSQTVANQ
ncbi:MAG: LamG-like jellyroll fold domain-containing protein, partial [Ferruginibacter sp.]